MADRTPSEQHLDLDTLRAWTERRGGRILIKNPTAMTWLLRFSGLSLTVQRLPTRWKFTFGKLSGWAGSLDYAFLALMEAHRARIREVEYDLSRLLELSS